MVDRNGTGRRQDAQGFPSSELPPPQHRRNPRPGPGMGDDSEVYADWSGSRALVLGLAAAALMVIAGLFLSRSALFGAGAAGESDAAASSDGDGPEVVDELDIEALAADTAQRFAASLSAGRLDEVTYAFVQPATARSELEAVTAELGPYQLVVEAGPVRIDDPARSHAVTRVAWTLEDGTTFTTEGVLDLVLVGDQWQVDWDVGVLEATLAPSDRLVDEAVRPPRQPILDRNGFGLIDERSVYEVSIVPRNADNPDNVVMLVADMLGLDGPELADRVRRVPSDSRFVITVGRVDDIETHRSALVALPGITLVESTRPLPPRDGFARALLGRSGEVTAEILERSPDYFEVGDIVGRSGLQGLYNEQLAGLPGRQIRIERRFARQPTTSAEEPDGMSDPASDPDVLFYQEPTGAAPVQTTIDHRVQTAAEAALATTEQVSALVVVQASTGQVLAVANGPGAAVQDRALTGSYPPGSVFKVATAYAGLVDGFGPETRLNCPGQMVVDGREFGNYQGEEFGNITFLDAFTHSCNTAFIELGFNLSGSDLPGYARQFGIGTEYDLGTASFSGSVPNPGGQTDKAATMFGQGRVVVSPLSMAVMASTVASGSYRPPTLVVGDSAQLATGTAEATTLDPAAVDGLRLMMAAVVQRGTGRAAATGGGQVHGKTGTAEFGSEVPPRTHAWFVGYQADLAVAVLVEDGGSGGSVAAPIAASFFSQANAALAGG